MHTPARKEEKQETLIIHAMRNELVTRLEPNPQVASEKSLTPAMQMLLAKLQEQDMTQLES